MANVNVTIRMDQELKKKAEELFDELGLNLSSAINIFIRQAVREQRIPFSITKKENIQYADSKQYEAAVKKNMEENRHVYEVFSDK